MKKMPPTEKELRIAKQGKRVIESLRQEWESERRRNSSSIACGWEVRMLGCKQIRSAVRWLREGYIGFDEGWPKKYELASIAVRKRLKYLKTGG